MALINTLRNRMGKIVVFALGLTMVAFILTDLVGNNSLLFGQDRDIAEIDGSDISMEDFQMKMEDLSSRFALVAGRRPQAEEMDQIREQAWQALLIEHLYQKQLDELGIRISELEQIDMVQGSNIHPQIRQAFTNQSGQFDQQALQQQLAAISQGSAQDRANWSQFESNLIMSKRFMKLNALVSSTNYVTKAEARNEYKDQSSAATIEYVYVPYAVIENDEVEITDSDLDAYLEANAYAYQKEASRDLAYVAFPLAPSSTDSLVIETEMAEVMEGLAGTTNDSTFALRNSDGSFPFVNYRKHELPTALLNAEGVPVEVGTVTEPIIDQNGLIVYKLSKVTEGPEYYTKVRHILIKWSDDSNEAKMEALTRAKGILGRVRSGEDFTALAAAESEDLSNAQRGGDLGWVSESTEFVEPFKTAVFNHVGAGIIPRAVETQFGYHIIKLDEPKTNQVFKVAVVEKDYLITTETIDSVNRETDLFYTQVANYDDFIKIAEERNLEVKEIPEVPSTAERLGSLGNARSVVLWLYNEASVGDISREDTQDAYVVAIMTGEQKKGTSRLSAVKEEVREELLKDKKAAMIREKLAPHLTKSLEEIVAGYGAGATAGEATFNWSAITVSGMGNAPEVVGAALGMENNEISGPIMTDQGVVVFQLVSRVPAADQENYATYAQQLIGRYQARMMNISNFPLTAFPIQISQKIDAALQELSELEDKRYKFY